MNWYRNAKIAESIYQEAALREWIPVGILGAMVAVFMGSAISNAAKHNNVAEEELQQALSNKEMVQQVQQAMQTTSPEQLLSPKNMESNKSTSQPEKPKELSKQDKININVIARTIYAEGKGESYKALRAIASVIYNRGNNSFEGAIGAIKKPKHFSCWNKANASDWTNMKQGKGSTWNYAMQLAESMFNGTFSTDGDWNHYYNPKKCSPYWAYLDKSKTKLRPHEAIGSHYFMKIK